MYGRCMDTLIVDRSVASLCNCITLFSFGRIGVFLLHLGMRNQRSGLNTQNWVHDPQYKPHSQTILFRFYGKLKQLPYSGLFWPKKFQTTLHESILEVLISNWIHFFSHRNNSLRPLCRVHKYSLPLAICPTLKPQDTCIKTTIM